jgi:chemotaxis protein CheD
MDAFKKDKIEHVTIHPGEHYVSNKDVIISTLLGSCIAACLYDPINRVLGMNHFLLSNKRYAKDIPVCTTEAGRYGIHAMELIINGMLKLGAERRNLRAKAFGGSSLLPSMKRPDNFFCVGEVNCRFIVEFLKNDGIPLVASDLGGDRGRVIHFSSADYSVRRRKIRRSGASHLQQNERQFWMNSMKTQERVSQEPDIWL